MDTINFHPVGGTIQEGVVILHASCYSNRVELFSHIATPGPTLLLSFMFLYVIVLFYSWHAEMYVSWTTTGNSFLIDYLCGMT